LNLSTNTSLFSSTSPHTGNTQKLDSPQSRPLSHCTDCGPALKGAQLKEALMAVPSWSLTLDKQSIKKSFKFSDFSSAFAFISRLALYSEKVSHHAKIINVYNSVEIELTTHSQSGVTQADIKMAHQLDLFALHK